jgi:hypothetical protein
VKDATLVTRLTSLTMAMAIAAPLTVFGLLYILLVQPERAAALVARGHVEAARVELNRRRELVRVQGAKRATSALDEFDARTAEGTRIGEVSDVLTAALNGLAVGGVSNLTIAAGAPVDDTIDSMAALFSRKFVQTPLTVTFDARYEQVARFFGNLGVLPTTFDLHSVELTPRAASLPGFMRAKVSLLVFHRTTLESPH